MKKVITKLVPIALVTLLAFPAAVQAKGMENSAKAKCDVKEKSYQSANMNARWSRIELVGENGEGELKVLDNPVFRYEIVSGGENGELSNGDELLINAINRGGNVVKQLNYTVEGLGDEDKDDDDDVDETESVNVRRAYQNLDETYGAVRLQNFDNQSRTSEAYLTDEQKNLGLSAERTEIDFDGGTTIDDVKRYGDWEDQNTIRFGYDADEEEVWVEIDAEYTYRAEYDTDEDADIDAIQVRILNGNDDSVVEIENIKLNGDEISDDLIEDSDWLRWNLEGDILKSNGDFEFEADLVITGDQEDNESKVEIMFGQK